MLNPVFHKLLSMVELPNRPVESTDHAITRDGDRMLLAQQLRSWRTEGTSTVQRISFPIANIQRTDIDIVPLHYSHYLLVLCPLVFRDTCGDSHHRCGVGIVRCPRPLLWASTTSSDPVRE